MDIHIHVTKTQFLVFLGVVLLATGLFVVHAYGGGNPNVMGHSVGELEDVQRATSRNCGDGQFLQSIGPDGATSCGSVGADEFRFREEVNECQSTDCTATCNGNEQIISGHCSSFWGSNWDFFGVRGNSWKCGDASWRPGNGPLTARALCMRK